MCACGYGFWRAGEFARLGGVGTGEKPTNETHRVYLRIYCG